MLHVVAFKSTADRDRAAIAKTMQAKLPSHWSKK
jgi:hypothetical protein